MSVQPMLSGPGGWITGQVINTKTGQPMALNSRGERITIGVFGPARPKGKGAIKQVALAVLDDTGSFRVRAAVGENYPYLGGIRGERMAWNTHDLPPIVVAEGSATECILNVTPPPTAAEKLAKAEKVLEVIPIDADKRVAAIIEELRRLNHTVDETETWCSLMRELTIIGSDAVPALCKEFETTDDSFMMRRLAFSLRAIGDPRAVPTLIRVLPKTLLIGSSDMSLIVEDKTLSAFMRRHSARQRTEVGAYFDFGRAVRETHSTLTRLTKRNVDGSELFGMMRSIDRRRVGIQEKQYHEAAAEWSAWWEANAEQFGVEPEFRKVNLPAYRAADLSDYPTGRELTKNAQAGTRMGEYVLRPIGDTGDRGDFFLDLDTGRRLGWPQGLPREDSSAETVQAAKESAAKRQADLMCVAMPDLNGKLTYTLTGIGLKLWEIKPSDAQDIRKRIADGKLPEGREVKDVLWHYDTETNRLVPNRGGSFLYLTREQGLGVINITGLVTEVGNPGGYGPPLRGVGYNHGVRFNHQYIAR